MTKEERILLRDELFNEFKQIGIITKGNQFLRLKLKKIQDSSLQEKWQLYVNEFRSNEEAIYCILKHDDFENHKCFKCGEIYKFDSTLRQKIKYYNKCEKPECVNKYYSINEIELLQFIKEQYQLKGTKLTISEILKVFKLSYSTLNHYIKDNNLLEYVKINVHKHIQHYDIWSDDEKFIEYIKEQYKKNGLLTLSQLKNTFIDNDSIIKKQIVRLNLLEYFHIRQNDYRHIQHYDIWSDDEKFIEHIKEQYGIKGILKTSELENYFSVCNASIRTRIRQLNLLKYVYIRKCTQKNVTYPDIWNNNEKFIQFIKEQYNLKGSLLKVSEIRKYLSVNDDSLREKIRKFNLLEYFYIKPTSKVHIQHYDIWSDDEKFIQFIKEQYNLKGLFLGMTEIAQYFNVCSHRVRLKITKLNLLEYFYIQQSNLEVDFESFLKEYNIQFNKHNKSTLGYNKEIDFLCDNIGFEINDIITHNSSDKNHKVYKHPTYHLEKTLLAQQNGIKLIHIWEWELRTESIWNKLSKWILNQLNSNKISIDVNQCTICEIDLTEAKQFFELYDINNFKECDHYIGVYYQNDLICMLLINTTGEAHITLKYNYILYDKQKLLLDYCKRMNMNRLIAYCDLSKDYGDELKHLGFKLTNLFEPNIIWCNKEMEIFKEQYSNCVPIYNCGYNIFELIDESEENPYNV